MKQRWITSYELMLVATEEGGIYVDNIIGRCKGIYGIYYGDKTMIPWIKHYGRIRLKQ